jgi:hypothetical protein
LVRYSLAWSKHGLFLNQPPLHITSKAVRAERVDKERNASRG